MRIRPSRAPLAKGGLLTLLVAALCWASLGQAEARTPRGPGLRIVAPAHGALVDSGAVRLRVRGAGRGGIRIYAGSRRLRVRVAPARGGTRTARLRPGRDLHRGTNVISVRASGGGFDQTEFVVGRRRHRLLSVRRVPLDSRGGPLGVRASTSSAVDGFRVRLNGHRVERSFLRRGRRLRSAALGASEGLRFGRNRLVVLAYRTDGRYDREVRRFRVARNRPLAGAGRDRRAEAGQGLRLDGRASKPTRRGRRLDYRWRIVGGPRAGVKLRHARSARPRLIAARPGRYRVELVVRESARRGRHPAGKAGAEVRAVASTVAPMEPAEASQRPETTASTELSETTEPAEPAEPTEPTKPSEPTSPAPLPVEPPAFHALSAPDTTTVTVAPRTPPIGVPISTIPTSGELTVGGKPHPPQADQGAGPQLLVLDRQTLVEDVKAESAYDFEAGGWASLSTAVAGASTDELVILSGGGRQPGCEATCAATMKKALGTIGGSWDSYFNHQLALAAGEWSLIGVPGSEAGAAIQSFGIATGPDHRDGDLSGYLQLDNHLNYKFVFGQYLPVDTAVPGQPPGTNAISVGGVTYDSDPSGYLPGKAGFQVLVLDQGTLQPYLNATYWTNEGGSISAAGVTAMATVLRAQVAIGSVVQRLVIVQSIGAAGPIAGGNWQAWQNAMPAALAGVGGTLEVARLYNLDGPGTHEVAHHLGAEPGGYSLVGGTGLPGFGTEQTYWYSGQPARIDGVLTRNNLGQLEIAYSGADGSSSAGAAELGQVAYQPPTPWPDMATAGQRAAYTYISGQLPFQTQDVRTVYYENDTLDWNSAERQLARIGYPGGSHGFTAAEFEAVKGELEEEFELVAQVRALISAYQTKLFGSSSEDSNLVDLQDIAQQIERAVSVEADAGASSAQEAAEITGILLGVAGEAGSLVDPAAGLPLDAAAAGFQIAGSVSDDPQGNPLPGKVAVRADQLGVELADRYEQIADSLDHVGDLLVSDYGKLTAAGHQAEGQWGLNTSTIEAAQNALNVSSQRWVYGTLMPVAYDVYGLDGSWNTGSRVWDPYYYRCFSEETNPDGTAYFHEHHRFEDANWSTYYATRSDEGPWYAQILSTPIDFWSSAKEYLSVDNRNATPPTGLTQHLFESPQASEFALGMNQPTFFARNAFANITVKCAEER